MAHRGECCFAGLMLGWLAVTYLHSYGYVGGWIVGWAKGSECLNQSLNPTCTLLPELRSVCYCVLLGLWDLCVRGFARDVLAAHTFAMHRPAYLLCLSKICRGYYIKQAAILQPFLGAHRHSHVRSPSSFLPPASWISSLTLQGIPLKCMLSRGRSSTPPPSL